MEWAYFIFGMIIYQVLKMLALAINNAVIEHRQKRLLKLVNVEFPDNSKITFIAVDASDKRVMAKLERQVRDEFGIHERLDQDGYGDSGGFRSPSYAPADHRQDPPRGDED